MTQYYSKYSIIQGNGSTDGMKNTPDGLSQRCSIPLVYRVYTIYSNERKGGDDDLFRSCPLF